MSCWELTVLFKLRQYHSVPKIFMALVWMPIWWIYTQFQYDLEIFYLSKVDNFTHQLCTILAYVLAPYIARSSAVMILIVTVHVFGTYFTKDLWVHNWNLVKILFAVIIIVMIQLGHNFAHVTTAQLSWHEESCDLIWSLFSKQERHTSVQDLDYELTFVK